MKKVADLARKIVDVIGGPIAATDIQVCHRVPTRQTGKPNVIVQFSSRQKWDAVLEKARKNRVKSNQLGMSGEAQVFVNEHLCPTLKRLFALALARKRECQWKFLWTRNGKILARKSEETHVTRIEKDQDLGKIA